MGMYEITARNSQSFTPNVGVRGMTLPASLSPAFLASAVMVEVDILFVGSSSELSINFDDEQEARYVLDLECVRCEIKVEVKVERVEDDVDTWRE
jgi:hypothetical protein